MMHLEKARGGIGDEPLLGHEVLTIERPPLLGGRSRQNASDVPRKRARRHDLKVMPRNALVQRRAGQLRPAMQPPRLVRPGQRDEEGPTPIAIESGRALIGGERDERAKEVGSRRYEELSFRNGDQPALDGEIEGGPHRTPILVDRRVARGCVLTETTHDVTPRAVRTKLGREALELRNGLGAQTLTEAQQLIGVLGDHVRGMELEVEQLTPYAEVRLPARLQKGECVSVPVKRVD